MILAEEVLTPDRHRRVGSAIAEQPSWSDFPLILLTEPGKSTRRAKEVVRARQPLGNLVLLERPIRPETFVSTVQAALRSRRRQYQMRDYLADSHIRRKKRFVDRKTGGGRAPRRQHVPRN